MSRPPHTFSLNCCFKPAREHWRCRWRGGGQLKCTMGDEEVEICSFCAFGQAGQLNVFSFNPIFPKRFIFSLDKINHTRDRSKRIGNYNQRIVRQDCVLLRDYHKLAEIITRKFCLIRFSFILDKTASLLFFLISLARLGRFAEMLFSPVFLQPTKKCFELWFCT